MIWKFFKDKAVLDRIRDRAFYDAAIDEIETGSRRQSLWVQALVETQGDERSAKFNYIKLLVIALKDEAYIAERLRSDKPSASGSIFTPEQHDQMRRNGVIHNGSYFECGEMHFDKFDEAIAYGSHKRQQAKV